MKNGYCKKVSEDENRYCEKVSEDKKKMTLGPRGLGSSITKN